MDMGNKGGHSECRSDGFPGFGCITTGGIKRNSGSHSRVKIAFSDSGIKKPRVREDSLYVCILLSLSVPLLVCCTLAQQPQEAAAARSPPSPLELLVEFPSSLRFSSLLGRP